MKNLYFGLFLLSLSPIFAQDNLLQTLKKTQSLVKEVKLEKSTVNQELDFDSKMPYMVKVKIKNTDSKGKSIEEVYDFNLGLINEINRVASSKEMKVELNAVDKNKFIGFIENEKKGNYTNKFVIYSENIDDARELEKSLKEAIKLGKTAWEADIKLPKEELTAYGAWVENLIKDVVTKKGDIKQKLTKSNDYKDKASFETTANDSKNTIKSTSEFSWADLNEKKTEIKVNGEDIMVAMKFSDDFVKNTENELSKSFSNGIDIYFNTPSDANILLMGIKKLIPIAKKELGNRMLKVSTKEEGFKKITGKVANLKVNEATYTQSLENQCFTTYNTKLEEKGKTTEEVFKFNFADIGAFDLNIKKELVKITAKTEGSNKYIEVIKNGELQNYEKSFDMLFNDLEGARTSLEAFQAIAKGCKSTISAGDFNSFNNQISALESPKQEVTKEENCKWKYTSTSKSSKKESESIYEFNLYDLDAQKIELSVSGKTVNVEAATLKKEKFIKLTKDSKPSFTNTVSFELKGIMEGQKALATIKALVEGCKK